MTPFTATLIQTVHHLGKVIEILGSKCGTDPDTDVVVGGMIAASEAALSHPEETDDQAKERMLKVLREFYWLEESK